MAPVWCGTSVLVLQVCVCTRVQETQLQIVTLWCYVQSGKSEDEQTERLLGVLEQSDNIPLDEFYAALRADGQQEIADLLQKWWKNVSVKAELLPNSLTDHLMYL